MTAADDSQLQAALAKYANLPGKQSATWNTAYSIITYTPGFPTYKLDYHLRGMDSLFCASAFKVFVLTAYLYYAERGELPNQPSEKGYASPLAAALAEPLTIDASDHTQDSKVFGYEFGGYPTGVTGTTSASAILVAMIAYSDNTATDIAIKRVGVDNVRKFMYETARLKSPAVRIPDSTEKFVEYLSQHPGEGLINDKETMVCTAGVFAEFYGKALHQYYLKNEETRRLYKWFLSTSEAIPQGIPEDMTCYMKGGMANYAGQHALAASGQVTVPYKAGDNGTLNVQFSMLYNWSDLNGVDNWGTGVQAWTASFKEVFAALRAYVLQLK